MRKAFLSLSAIAIGTMINISQANATVLTPDMNLNTNQLSEETWSQSLQQNNSLLNVNASLSLLLMGAIGLGFAYRQKQEIEQKPATVKIKLQRRQPQ